MNKRTRRIEVVIGEKYYPPDVAEPIKGSSTPIETEVAGRSAAGAAFLFECPWCGAINHALESRDGVYICFSCGRPMQPSFA